MRAVRMHSHSNAARKFSNELCRSIRRKSQESESESVRVLAQTRVRTRAHVRAHEAESVATSMVQIQIRNHMSSWHGHRHHHLRRLWVGGRQASSLRLDMVSCLHHRDMASILHLRMASSLHQVMGLCLDTVANSLLQAMVLHLDIMSNLHLVMQSSLQQVMDLRLDMVMGLQHLAMVVMLHRLATAAPILRLMEVLNIQAMLAAHHRHMVATMADITQLLHLDMLHLHTVLLLEDMLLLMLVIMDLQYHLYILGTTLPDHQLQTIAGTPVTLRHLVIVVMPMDLHLVIADFLLESMGRHQLLQAMEMFLRMEDEQIALDKWVHSAPAKT